MDTKGGGWTVFLHRQRQTPQLDFAQTWTSYKDGFGTPTGEYWLGEDVTPLVLWWRDFSVCADIILYDGMMVLH